MDTPPDCALVDTRFTDKQCKIIQQKFHDRFTHPYLKPVNQSFWLVRYTCTCILVVETCLTTTMSACINRPPIRPLNNGPSLHQWSL